MGKINKQTKIERKSAWKQEKEKNNKIKYNLYN
jgi:hypothetical protein